MFHKDPIQCYTRKTKKNIMYYNINIIYTNVYTYFM